MRGFVRTISYDGTETIEELAAAPSIEDLQQKVGGYAQRLPHWDTLQIDWEQPCVALCNEDGKQMGLPVNRHATKEWASVLVRSGVIPSEAYLNQLDVLVGPVIVLWGDDAFMDAL